MTKFSEQQKVVANHFRTKENDGKSFLFFTQKVVANVILITESSNKTNGESGSKRMFTPRKL